MSVTRPVAVTLTGLAVAAVAVALALSLNHEEGAGPVALPPAASPAPAPGQPETDLRNPSFDVVRIGSQGEAVIAGRAMPRAEVAILDGGTEIGRAMADARGEWVFVPDRPFAPGARELSLKATNPDGSITQSDAPVVLVIPGPESGTALAVKPMPGGSRLLTGPVGGEGAPAMTIDVVDHDGLGRLFVGGRAQPGAKVQVYMDNQFLGRAQADAEGDWRVAAQAPARGTHALRADQVDAKGKVLARVELPYEAGQDVAATDHVVVQPGHSLWKIARRSYGSGPHYTVIYQANRAQIRDPDLIYPGQVFALPR